MLPLPQGGRSWGVGGTTPSPPIFGQFVNSFSTKGGGGEDYDPQIFRPFSTALNLLGLRRHQKFTYSPPLFFDINILEPENIRLKFSFQSIYQPRSVNATTLAN